MRQELGDRQHADSAEGVATDATVADAIREAGKRARAELAVCADTKIERVLHGTPGGRFDLELVRLEPGVFEGEGHAALRPLVDVIGGHVRAAGGVLLADEFVEVGRRHDEDAAGGEELCDAAEHGRELSDVFNHLEERDELEGTGGRAGRVVEIVEDLDVLGAEEVAGGLGGLGGVADPVGREAEEEAAIAGADVDGIAAGGESSGGEVAGDGVLPSPGGVTELLVDDGVEGVVAADVGPPEAETAVGAAVDGSEILSPEISDRGDEAVVAVGVSPEGAKVGRGFVGGIALHGGLAGAGCRADRANGVGRHRGLSGLRHGRGYGVPKPSASGRGRKWRRRAPILHAVSADARAPLHIVLLNQAFYPDVVATAQMSKDLADALARRGHRVTAVASRSIYGKTGAVLPTRESIAVEGAAHAIEARRVGASLFGKASIATRILDFGLFYVMALARIVTLPRPDVIVCFTTPPFIAMVGLMCQWIRGSRAIYWVMDLYPDLPVACGVMKPRALPTRVFEALNRVLLRHSDADVVLGRCMEERVLAKGTPRARVHRIPVWSDLGAADVGAADSGGADSGGAGTGRVGAGGFRERWKLDGRVAVMYSGNFGLGHDAGTVCDAMRRLKDEERIRFVFVGGGKRRAEVEAFAAREGLKNVAYYDYVPREQLKESLTAADIHLISLKEGVEGIMVPSKLYGIMATGRPSIFVGHPGSEIARTLEETGGGMTIREGDGEGLARAILALARDASMRERMGRSAAAGLVGHYDVATACGRWIELIERLGGGESGRKGRDELR